MRQWMIDAFATAPFKGNPACVVEPLERLAGRRGDAGAGRREQPGRDRLPAAGPTIRPASACAGSPRRSRCRCAATRRWPRARALRRARRSPRRGDLRHPVRAADRRRARATATGWTSRPACRAASIRRPASPRRWASTPQEVWAERYLIAVLADEDAVRAPRARPRGAEDASPASATQGRGNVGVSALARPGAGYDVVSRFFAPGSGHRRGPGDRQPALRAGAAVRRQARPPAAGASTRPIRAAAATWSARRGASGCWLEGQAVTVAESRLRVALCKRRAQAAAAAALAPGRLSTAAHGLVELGDLDRLGDVAVHAGGEVLLDLVHQRVGGQRQDRRARPAARRARRRGSPGRRRCRPSPASGCPSGSRRSRRRARPRPPRGRRRPWPARRPSARRSPSAPSG